MTIENLKQNIDMEKKLLKEILMLNSQAINSFREEDKRILTKALNSAIEKLLILNNSIPAVLEGISPFRKLEEKEDKIKGLVKISYSPEGERERISVTLNKEDKKKFLKELSLGKETLKRLKVREKEVKKEVSEYRRTNWYAKFANRIFLGFSTKYLNKGKLARLNLELRKANMPFLVTTYFSMILLSALISFFAGISAAVILLFTATINTTSILESISIVIFLPIITFFSFYFYPYIEGKDIKGRISQELPFAAIHMSAIAGSGIEPTHIFKIIALGEEYPNVKNEFKKIVNQVNVYGYDLITALKNTARETSSGKMSELLNGMATAISSGGNLSDFLDKRAETLLFEYKLEREKKIKSAETFMDIYISIVIAAPMIMTLLLVLISVSGIGIGLSLSQLTIIIISVVSLINLAFLVFLHLSQRGY